MASATVYQRKLALIIGINSYRRNSLIYCINDATDLKTTLQRINFKITYGENCNLTEFYSMIDTFTNLIEHNDLVLFYFAGHGLQNGDDNYLLPADYNYPNRGYERDYLVDHAINVKYITKKIDDSDCRITAYLFDCCRNLIKTRTMNASQGLLPMYVPSQTLIVFACAPGKAVQDETRNNRNGSFIESLVKHIEKPDKDIEEIMKNVARDVNLQTNGFQLPYRTSSLTDPVFLVSNKNQKEKIASSSININTKWKQDAIIIAGGNGNGDQLNQLSHPDGIYVDDKNQAIYIADSFNHRIVEWKLNAKNGQIVAGGNGQGNQMNQLNYPSDVIVNENNNSLIVCDWGNRRVVQWSRQNHSNGETIISDIDCSGLTMDKNGSLYVSDWKKDEIRRWKRGDTNGIVVAGGNGKGNKLNQLDGPTYLFVDKYHSVYVSDWENHRVMKWMKGAKEGIIVAGGQGQGDSLEQLSYPQGVFVDRWENVYVVDSRNDRIMRWSKGSKEGSIIIGENGEGNQPNHMNDLRGLFFDEQENLYVVNCRNDRVQKFLIDKSGNGIGVWSKLINYFNGTA